jgi:hypothetical protein
MELVEGDRHIVRTADLAKIAPDVLAAARRAGILRPEDPGFEDISATDLARVLRVLYGLSGRGRPVPAVFDDAAAPLGWMGTEKNAREVLFCARPASGFAKALERRRPTLVLVPTARHLTPALRKHHAPGAVVTLEALEESIVALGGRLVRRATIAPDGPEIAPRPLEPSMRLVGLAKRWTEMRFCLIDNTSVRIDVPGRSIRCTHVDLGMAHPRTRQPTNQWEVVWEFCEHGGYFRTSRLGNANATRQLIHRVSRHLQALFGIQGSPIHRYRRDCGWRSRFEAQHHLPGEV